MEIKLTEEQVQFIALCSIPLIVLIFISSFCFLGIALDCEADFWPWFHKQPHNSSWINIIACPTYKAVKLFFLPKKYYAGHNRTEFELNWDTEI